ncbi:hypothetical protein [Trichlorobacter ammonificans]|uniref:HEAT repeat domain-containing protein n=1 Tax=Trichlorobacter ammonificans TaxID=2916410 RepID=A0ABM9D3M1_9BACT|nr:hypothetical protein [Trichlorobacter ammonificans]CAH2029830.1 conserved protein of unknown function [Trichlorobacter ammonificans]
MNPRTIDTSYRERRRIVRLLDFLTREQLTRDQMERIGRRLQKAGTRALPPLVRRLWKERDRERLFRYTCMLDFFDVAVWMDQLVTLTLQRRDLADDERVPLLEILQDYGVDVSSPPFARQAGGQGPSVLLDSCLDDETWGMIRFMDRFLDADEPLREQLIKRLGGERERGAAAAAFLRMLAHFEFSEVAGLAVDALGTLRHGCALTVLGELRHLTVEGLEARVERSRRRLGFLGINEPLPLPARLACPERLVAVQARPLDAQGLATLWFSWELSEQRYTGLILQTSEHDGVVQAMANLFESRAEHDDYLDDVNAEEGMFPIDAAYGLRLLRDAVMRSIEHNYYLPPDLYASRHLFGDNDLRPRVYLPSFDPALLSGLTSRLASYLANSETLLDEPFFEGWLLHGPTVYTIAESMGSEGLEGGSPDEQHPFVERFCAEIIEPDRAGIVRRLLLIADFIQQVGCYQALVQRTLAVSLSLAGGPLPLARHPFIRRLALDSLEMARRSLAEGIDPRQQMGEDEGEWE